MNRLYNTLVNNTFFIAGPCVMESFEIMDEVASLLADIRKRKGYNIIFKASFDKANRTSIHSFRGPGIDKGMKWIADIRHKYNIPVTTDIHERRHAIFAGRVVDIIQIPAFLCRQTDLLVSAASTGKIINIKKAQFLSPESMQFPAEKVKELGNNKIILTERGNIIGYNNLIVDFRSIPIMKQLGYPVVMDCTHSVQSPGGSVTLGNRNYVKPMALAAKAFEASGYFFEIHPNPDKGLSDAANMINMKDIEDIFDLLIY